MRKLTIDIRISNYELDFLEKKIDVTLPNNFRLFLQSYAGLSVKENQFLYEMNGKKRILVINEFLSFTEIFELSKKIIVDHGVKMIPFANDPNGMYFFLSCEDKDNYEVFILSIDLSNHFIKIDNSFDHFINQLKHEDEMDYFI